MRSANPPEKHCDMRATTRTPGSSCARSGRSSLTAMASFSPQSVIRLSPFPAESFVPWSVT